MTNKDDQRKDKDIEPEEVVDSMGKKESVVSSDDVSTTANAEQTHDDEQLDESDLDESQEMINTLTSDLQRTRADFENYQKRAAQEKETVRSIAVRDTIAKLLPVIDIVEQAASHIPSEVVDTPFGKGMASLEKKLAKQLRDLGVEKVGAESGDNFDPELHNAVQVDEDAEGDTEVIADVLQAGYKKDGEVIRYSMVRVTRK